MSYTATINVTTGILEKTIEELNGHEEMIIQLANTVANRALVATDQDATLTWSVGPVTVFQGRCTGAKHERGLLKCKVYNTAYEQMQRAEPYTDTFDEGADVASDVLTALGAHVGIAVSWDPVADPAIGVIIDIANPMDILIWLAEVTGNDFWVTYGPLTLHIGARGAARGAIAIMDGSTRLIDRSAQRDRVVVRGWDADGNQLIADTAAGGTRYARFVHKKPVNQATLDALAAKKLVDLNKDDGPSPLVLTPASGNTTPIFPGDTVTLDDAELALPSAGYRVFKVERYIDKVIIYPEVWDASTDRAIWDTRKYEDLGIYQIGVGQLPKGVQNWNSDVVFSVTDWDTAGWGAGTIVFSDGATQVINAGNTGNLGAAATYYVYFTYGSATLSVTNTYSNAVGPEKGLLAKLTVSAYTNQFIGIETYGSVGTRLNVDLLANRSVTPDIVQIELRKWTNDLGFIWDEANRDWDEIWWGQGGDEVNTDAVVLYSDGVSVGINRGHYAGLADGLYWVYWDNTQKTATKYDLQFTTDYTNAVGEGKGFIALVLINEAAAEAPSMIVVDGYTPIIGGGIIAAYAIKTVHIDTEYITARYFQTAANVGTGVAGVRINPSGIYGYDNGNPGIVQVFIEAATGKILAGAGAVVLDVGGLSVIGQFLTFKDGGASEGWVWATVAGLNIQGSDDLNLIAGAGDQLVLRIGTDDIIINPAGNLDIIFDANFRALTPATFATVDLGSPTLPFRYFTPRSNLAGRPAADATTVGTFWATREAGANKELLWWCALNAASGYEWVQVSITT